MTQLKRYSSKSFHPSFKIQSLVVENKFDSYSFVLKEIMWKQVWGFLKCKAMPTELFWNICAVKWRIELENLCSCDLLVIPNQQKQISSIVSFRKWGLNSEDVSYVYVSCVFPQLWLGMITHRWNGLEEASWKKANDSVVLMQYSEYVKLHKEIIFVHSVVSTLKENPSQLKSIRCSF